MTSFPFSGTKGPASRFFLIGSLGQPGCGVSSGTRLVRKSFQFTLLLFLYLWKQFGVHKGYAVTIV